ncbi:hypothetical protein C1645_834427 [Glomus cerebriforme]|uniref:Uncharacterized protein n=1 Tax=Glomus cerebriforme TaxID=658196 RepID=A0A397SJP8_9GLOM|nr:hypothetical protein C1645_834427 [Glomus cerebriforme]
MITKRENSDTFPENMDNRFRIIKERDNSNLPENVDNRFRIIEERNHDDHRNAEGNSGGTGFLASR